MSKKKAKKISTKKVKNSKPESSPTPKARLQFSFDRPSTVQPADPLYKRLFYGTFLVIALFTFVLAFQSGMNGDDEFQNDYATKLVDYYLTMGQDTAALYVEKGNMHYYGGLFDLTTGLVNRGLGYTDYDLAYHQIRHLFNAVFGLLLMFFVGLLAQKIIGWRGALLALVFAFFSPRLLGHTFMNPKDIPFAAGFAIALYYMTVLLEQLPKPNWKTAAGIAIGFGIALGTRAGGLLLVGYLGLFMAADFLLRFGVQGFSKRTTALLQYAIFGIGIVLSGYVLGILTWPAALVDPIGHPYKALTEFSDLGVKIRLLFQGENVMSDATAWYYPLLWIVLTVPLFVIIGLLINLMLGLELFKRYPPLPYLLLVFASLFPLFYVIYKDSILHDGWRHLIFVYPSMIVLAAMGWIFIEEKLKHQQMVTYAIWGMLALTVIEPAIFILRNTHLPYVYFNPLGGGISSAFGKYETDYWGVSVKQAVDWMEKEGILGPNMTDTIVIGTHFYYNVDRLTRERFNGKVRTKYVRFNQRYGEDWDYGIFPSRFIRSPHLKSGNWPASKAVHVVKANGIPITAIEHQPQNDAFLGETAIKQKDWNTAIQHFSKEVQNYPDNEVAWVGLANAYLNLNQNQEALSAAQKALEVAPKNENGLYFTGMAKLRTGDNSGAALAFEEVLEVNESFYIANYYLALIYQQQQQINQALDQVLQAIKSNPRFKAGYQLAAQLYAAIGDQNSANAYQEAANKL